jgi:DNA-binding MarR family transcriptional regulator
MQPWAIAGISASECAARVTETIPHVMKILRARMREATALPSVVQVRALGHVKRHPGTSITELAGHLGVKKATASVLVEKLAERGLLTRVTRPRERRTAALTITPRGDRLLRSARQSTRERIASSLTPLSGRERAAVAAGLQLLSDALDIAEEKRVGRKVS